MGAVGVLIGASTTLGLAFTFVPALSAPTAKATPTTAAPDEPTSARPASSATAMTARATTSPVTRATTSARPTTASPVASGPPNPASSVLPAGRAAALQGQLPHDHDATNPYAPQAADAPLAKDVYESH
jgi:hypothetical protein